MSNPGQPQPFTPTVTVIQQQCQKRASNAGTVQEQHLKIFSITRSYLLPKKRNTVEGLILDQNTSASSGRPLAKPAQTTRPVGLITGDPGPSRLRKGSRLRILSFRSNSIHCGVTLPESRRRGSCCGFFSFHPSGITPPDRPYHLTRLRRSILIFQRNFKTATPSAG